MPAASATDMMLAKSLANKFNVFHHKVFGIIHQLKSLILILLSFKLRLKISEIIFLQNEIKMCCVIISLLFMLVFLIAFILCLKLRQQSYHIKSVKAGKENKLKVFFFLLSSTAQNLVAF